MTRDDLKKLAEEFTENCRTGKEAEGLKTLYAADAVSIEASVAEGPMPSEFVGVEAIKGKHEWWENAMEVHEVVTEGPYYHGHDRFALIFSMDVTEKEKNHRFQMNEVAIYTAKDGKIIREEFYYDE